MTNRPFEKPEATASGASPRKARTPRVFLGPIEVAGYYKALEKGLRSIGVSAKAVDLNDHPFRYHGESLRPPLLARPAIFTRRRLAQAVPASGVWKIADRIARVPLFLWALWRFDVFVLGFGESFFRLYDLPVLKWFGKRIVLVFHGSDLRPPYMDGPTMGGPSPLSISDCAHLTARKKERIRYLERYADVVISHPLYSHFLERPYVRVLAVGLPLHEIPVAISVRPIDGTRIRILHSPSHPVAKGTPRIREAIKELTDEGLPIDYVEISGERNAVVLGELRLADIVVDQLYSDTPMAGFATEAAGFGRPVIVGSCDWDEIRRAIPEDESGPVLACDAEGVAEAIRTLVTDPELRRELGDRARAFIVDHAGAAAVAQRFLLVINGSAPPAWVCAPFGVRHRCGAGLPSERVRDIVRKLVRDFGRASLQLGDKPELETELVAWAFGELGPEG